MYKILFVAMVLIIAGCSEDSTSFKNQRLSGKLDGKAWSANHVESQTFDFGTKKETKDSVYSMPCKEFECLSIKTPSIMISNLDPSILEGEFTTQNNITIFYPPSRNFIVTNGSFKKISENGKTKLNIKFNLDQDNYLDGYILY